MSKNGNGRNRDSTFTITTTGSDGLRYASLDEALAAARPVLLRLYQNWQRHRRHQVASFVADFVAQHGHPPTPAQVRDGVDPPLHSDGVAAYYSNGRLTVGLAHQTPRIAQS